jgi:hypothetical protein
MNHLSPLHFPGTYGIAHYNTEEPAKGEGNETVVSVSRQQREICESK